MKYLLLIQQGDTPTPGTDAWALVHSEAERRFLEERVRELAR